MLKCGVWVNADVLWSKTCMYFLYVYSENYLHTLFFANCEKMKRHQWLIIAAHKSPSVLFLVS